MKAQALFLRRKESVKNLAVFPPVDRLWGKDLTGAKVPVSLRNLIVYQFSYILRFSMFTTACRPFQVGFELSEEGDIGPGFR